MFNLQGSEIIVIVLLALVILGPEKLPDAIRRFTQTYSELKKMGSGFQSEIRSVLDEPMREMRETADLMKNSVDPDAVMADAEAELQRQAEAEADEMLAADTDDLSDHDDQDGHDTQDGDDDHHGSERERTAALLADTAPTSLDSPPPASTDPDGPPVNQIALANARGPIEPVPVVRDADPVVTDDTVDEHAIPTFATAADAAAAMGATADAATTARNDPAEQAADEATTP